MVRIISIYSIELLSFFIRFSGLSFLISKVLTKRKVKIVVYHNPKKEVFEKHIKYLSKRFNFIPLNNYVDALLLNDFSKIPLNSLCVTIDDGYKENFELLDTIKKYDVKPTIYLCSQIINTNRHYWDKECLKSQVMELKKCSNIERLKFMESEVGFLETKDYFERQALNLQEIDEMDKWVDFQFHSRYHADLAMCSSIEKEKEIREGRRDLEEILHSNCMHIAYPHGSYDDSVIEVVKKFGIKSGRTIDVGFNGKTMDPYKLKVTGISDDSSLNKVAAQLTGITMFLRYIFKGNFKGNFSKN